MLGQKGGAAMLPVAAGEQVGVIKDYGYSWDLGVVDTRWVVGQFATPDTPYFPPNDEVIQGLPGLQGVDVPNYHLGNQNRNAACFIDYMDDSTGMRTAWFNKLLGTPKSCGTDGWYVPGKLQGDWFNPAMKAQLPTLESDIAALTIVPDSLKPLEQVDFGIGNKPNGATGPSLAALDPSTWSPPVQGATQIANALTVLFDPTPGATINPDPASVGAGQMVCYDLAYPTYGGGYNSMLLYMNDSTHLEIKYDPTTQSAPQCATLMAASPTVDSSWIEYVR